MYIHIIFIYIMLVSNLLLLSILLFVILFKWIFFLFFLLNLFWNEFFIPWNLNFTSVINKVFPAVFMFLRIIHFFLRHESHCINVFFLNHCLIIWNSHFRKISCQEQLYFGQVFNFFFPMLHLVKKCNFVLFFWISIFKHSFNGKLISIDWSNFFFFLI